MNCHLNNLYVQDYHFINASKVFDIRTDPPKEIKNGSIEYSLSTQWLLHHDDSPVPFPYSDYFIDTIKFLDLATVELHKLESDSSKIYSYIRNDCGLELTSQDEDRHLELTQGGDEITEQRFIIYDHRSRGVIINSEYVRLDTFSFIEYRLGPFSSYEEIIKQFAIDNPGKYDTVAIELIQNKTRE